MNATLVVMAAGIGSRFGGGIKQLAPVGPNGEIIMDYSIYDAKEAGFNRVVFIIRHDLEKDFKEIIGDRVKKYIDVDYAFQDLNDLPEGFECPKERSKPWGTGQALLSVKGIVNEPFVVINADDYYGKEGFPKFLGSMTNELKSEYLLPSVIDEAIKADRISVEVLKSHDKWFGVTYKEDKEIVVNSIRALVDKGVYPDKIFN